MAAKFPTFDRESDIPAAFTSLYEERDGKWHPQADGDPDDLSAELAAERLKREAAEKGAIKTANELKKLERRLAAKEHDVSDEVLEKMRADIRREVEDEYAPRIADADKAVAENRSLKLDDRGKALAAKARFLPDKLNDYWKLHGNEFDLSATGDLIVKGKGAADVEKLIAAHAKARPEWVQGTGAAGGGAIGGAGSPVSGGLSFQELMQNPRGAIEAGNAKR